MPTRVRAAATLLVIALALPGAWMLAVLNVHGEDGGSYLHDWLDAGLQLIGRPTGASVQWLLHALPWYIWPLWPLAAWALYAWRHNIRRPHIALPALLLAVNFAGLLATPQPSAADAVFVVTPLVLLAAFGAVSMRRAAENVIDWFAITAFSLFSIALWAYFIAMRTGFPPKMSHSVLRLTAGFVPPFDRGQTLIALAATGFWTALVIWRVRRPAGALWRGPMLAATGLITLWVAFSALFLGAVDYRRSFAGVAQTVAGELMRVGQPGDCVVAHQLRPSHRAVFAFHGAVRFAAEGGSDCAFALHRDMTTSLFDDSPPPGQWVEIWQGHRPGRADELIRLYRRAGD
jgi:hypothetical protein